MKWPRLNDLLVFRPTAEDIPSSSSREEFSFDDPQSAHNGGPTSEAHSERWRRIRFDNAIRLWVAIPTYLTCLALWAGGAIGSILPISAVILGYSVILLAAFSLYFNIGFSRAADYVLGGIDLISMSCAVFLTGATASPLYFIYFVPVVIHAFHRDWDLILFSGFGGVVLYGIAVLVSLNNLSSASVADLCARLVFMLLTMAIACLGLSVLRKEEGRARRRIARLRAAASLGQRLISACSTAEIRSGCEDVLLLLASAMSMPDATVRFAFPEESLTMAASAVKAGSVSVPIATDGDAPFGLIVVEHGLRAGVEDEDLAFLRFVGRSVALCLRRQKGIDELGRSVELGTAVTAILLAAERSDRAAQTALLEGGMSLLGSEQAALFIWNEDRQRLEATAWMGVRPSEEKGMTFLSGQGFVGEAFLRKEERRSRDLSNDPLYRGREKGVRSLLAVPLQTLNGEVLGVLTLSRLEEDAAYSDEEALVASAFACRAAHVLRAVIRRTANAPVSPRLAA